MKTITVKCYVETNRVGSRVTGEFAIQVDDNISDEELEKVKEDELRDWMFENIEFGEL